jgi:hypothetical protein
VHAIHHGYTKKKKKKKEFMSRGFKLSLRHLADPLRNGCEPSSLAFPIGIHQPLAVWFPTLAETLTLTPRPLRLSRLYRLPTVELSKFASVLSPACRRIAEPVEFKLCLGFSDSSTTDNSVLKVK